MKKKNIDFMLIIFLSVAAFNVASKTYADYYFVEALMRFKKL